MLLMHATGQIAVQQLSASSCRTVLQTIVGDRSPLWVKSCHPASSVAGTPVTFSIKSRQYVAIAAGSGHLSLPTRIFPKIDQPGAGNALYVFALPE